MDLIKIIEKINEVGLSNNDITRYGDGFEDAIFKVKEVINELYKQDQALQLKQTGVNVQLCGNLDKNYNCKNMCLTHCVDGNKFYK